MYLEADLLALSGLQHLVFCERPCALIHLEQTWRENVLTAERRVLHERVDVSESEGRGDARVARAVPLRNVCLGLVGRAAGVEFHRSPDDRGGATIAGLEGRWQPFPSSPGDASPSGWIATECNSVARRARGAARGSKKENGM